MEGWIRFRSLSGLVACAAVVALVTGACRQADDQGGSTKTPSAKAAGGGGAVANVGGREGMQAPDFTLPKLTGGDLKLSSLRGKVVIVDFWDTWCGPCLRALPHLKDVSERHPDALVVVAVALGQEGEAKVREVVARNALPFPVVLLGENTDLLKMFGNVDGLPTTFLLDAEGVIRRRWVGAQPPQNYENAVAALLGS